MPPADSESELEKEAEAEIKPTTEPVSKKEAK